MKNIFQFLFSLSFSILIFSCEHSNSELNSNQVQSPEGMLQHNVYFYLNDSVSEMDKKDFEEELNKLLSIDVIHHSEVGKTGATKPREVTDHEFDYSIFTWFKSMDDYEVYANHSDHLKFIDDNKHLWTTVKVYDSEIIKTVAE